MNNNLVIFEHETFGSVRTIDIDGEIWFIAKDVADALGYASPDKMYKRLDEDEKKTTTIQFGGSYQKAVIINESGLYKAIFGSQKEEAKIFKKWVTSVILPSIRKTGSYNVSSQPIIAQDPIQAEIEYRTAKAYKAYLEEVLGMKGNDAILGSNVLTQKALGVNLLKLVGHEKLDDDDARPTYTPTALLPQISARINEKYDINWIKISAQAINNCLAENGYLVKVRDSDRDWNVTEKGLQYGKMKILTVEKANDKTKSQPQWYIEVLDLLEELEIENYISKKNFNKLIKIKDFKKAA